MGKKYSENYKKVFDICIVCTRNTFVAEKYIASSVAYKDTSNWDQYNK